jgi:arsenate reductase
MSKIKVLFVCIHNSARSQMAEAFLNHLGGKRFQAESAGLEAGTLNPRVVSAMAELGIDISANKTKNVTDFIKQEKPYDYVVTVCDESSAEKCPVFPGPAARLCWSFPDPSSLTGTEEQKLQRTREIRDQIQRKVQDWIFKMPSADLTHVAGCRDST